MKTTASQFTLTKQQLSHPALAEPIDLVTLTNRHGLTVSLSNLGGSIWSVTVPDKTGNESAIELVLNYQNIAVLCNALRCASF